MVFFADERLRLVKHPDLGMSINRKPETKSDSDPSFIGFMLGGSHGSQV